MDKIVIKGGRVLNGQVKTSGAKNSALPLIFSSLLAAGEHIFNNVPNLADIKSGCALLESLGCKTQFANNTLKIEVPEQLSTEAHYDIVRKMRASVLCLGPLLARYGFATVSLPGGCAIGTRPIDIHLDGMKALGAEIEIQQGYVHAKAKTLKATSILLDIASVGATENIMMAACLAEGTTILENAAKEPEIVDLANYLNKMGAKVVGAGSGVLKIEGVKKLKPSQHSVIPDRIEAGTLLIAGAITGGQVRVTDCVPSDLDPLVVKMREAGFQFETGPNWIEVKASKTCKAVDISTSPHPGFPTDLQAQYMALMTVAQGTSLISETVFENRFMHVQELVRLNADIQPKSRVAVVRGKPGGLQGAPVMATDLRASASLVLAGLVASGETHVKRIYHLDRGYENLELKLSSLGAQISREADV